MRTLNLGILAHVDAGKTSLTERLLHVAGVLDAPGSVAAGSTRTDTMALERQRGITIRSAVATFTVDDVLVNLLDTPGHADFIAEVERALSVLDGAVLVVSAVEGVQAQTVVLYRALRRLGIPTLVFVNKIDRSGADPAATLAAVARRLSPSAVALQRVLEAGAPTARVLLREADEPGHVDELTERLAEVDDEVLAAYADGTRLPAAGLRQRFDAQARAGAVHPVLFGSATTGAGVPELLAALPRLLPVRAPDPDAAASGLVFTIERGEDGEKLTYLLLRAGRIHVRDRLDLRRGRPERVTGLQVFAPGGTERSAVLEAGRIARVRGLDQARVGDVLGDPALWPQAEAHFSRPSLETVVETVDPTDRGALHAGLTQLAERDPLISVRQDDSRSEIAVSLYGEVQKEVLGSLLESDYGVEVTFGTSTVICVERVVGTGAAVEVVAAPSNPFLATVGLRVETAPVGSGVDFGLEVERGAMPAAFFTAVEDAVRQTLGCGPYGWEIPDCRVLMTHSGYYPRQSHAHQRFDKAMSSTGADFRYLTPWVLMTALLDAGTQVCEPVHRFVLEGPQDTQGALLAVLVQLDAVPLETSYADDVVTLTGDVPAASVHELRLRLPGLSRGEGVFTTTLGHFRPVRGRPPTRARIDDDPTDAEVYLRTAGRLAGRV
ncbi:GTP-binding protein [uncultured Friedmanniella sp.]|uniref:GTP-binding protein n=1 Tax=uncultured Friedmanniella sp. TaxID=335381 RepID=UPI0035CB0118